MSIIDFKDVFYSYPRLAGNAKNKKDALKNINLSVTEGEFLAVMGENGAGKTTFCKLINGIIPHLYGGNLSGSITVDNERTDKSSVPRLALKAGIVLDDPDSQIFTSSVRSETAFGPENLLLPPHEIEQRIIFALSATGLCGFENRNPFTLSGGEKQRLAISCALAMKGKILVLDEPLCRLDPEGAQEIMSVLKNLREKFKLTVIMASHDSAKMAEYADRVCILKNGQIAALDTAENIFSNHALLDDNGIQPCFFPAKINKYEQLKRDFQDVNLYSCESSVENCKKDAIKIENLSFTYPNGEKLDNINLVIKDNDFLCITGRNGCGKTTLLKNITGLLKPESGNIFLRGKNTKTLSVSDISKEAGFVMQNPDNQLFTDSVYNEVAFSLKNSKFSRKEIKKRTEEALEMTGLKDWDVFPHALSRADRAKTVIACILAMGCKIIIFDEVDAGQDYKGSLMIMNIARKLNSKGFTVVFVTHNLFLACEYAHRLIMLDKKGIVMDMKRRESASGKVMQDEK
jgi:energy-coupling factor transport system ATP-binding protein